MKVPGGSGKTLDRWRTMKPMQHVRQAKNVWIIGEKGSGKIKFALKLEEKLKGKYRPNIHWSDYGIAGISHALEKNDVVIRMYGFAGKLHKVYRVTVDKKTGRKWICMIGTIKLEKKEWQNERV